MGRLTKRIVETAEPPKVKKPADRKRWRWVGDDEIPGFGVKVYGSGLRTFALRYRVGGGREGRQRMLTLGRFGEITVEQARDMAREKKVEIKAGTDPLAKRQRKASAMTTAGHLMDRWLRDYAKVHRKRWGEDERRIERRIRPDLGKLRLEDLTVERVARWHRTIGNTARVEANRSLDTLGAAWRWAEREGLLPRDLSDPTTPVKRFRERSRDRWLRREELERLMEAVRAEDDPYIQAAVPLLLLTGLRKRELLDARWRDVDLDRAELRIPRAKIGEAQVRLLPSPAVNILRELPRHHNSPCVFPSLTDPSKPRTDFKRAWRRIRQAAGLDDVTMHDLRRTTGSHLAQSGVPLQVIGEVLGHTSGAHTRIYARLASQNEREALETLARSLEGVLGGNGGPHGDKDQEAGSQLLPGRLKALLEEGQEEGQHGEDTAAVAAQLRELASILEGKQ